jgi:hypothetical protein
MKKTYDGTMPTIAEAEALMKPDVRKIRLRSSTARAARVARAEADRIEGLRQAAKTKRGKP